MVGGGSVPGFGNRVILISIILLNKTILIIYHLFSCSICHADDKNIFVFKFPSILDLSEFVSSKTALKVHYKCVKKVLMSIARSKIIQMTFSLAIIASFHVCFWYLPKTPIFFDNLSTYYYGQNGKKLQKLQFWPLLYGHNFFFVSINCTHQN